MRSIRLFKIKKGLYGLAAIWVCFRYDGFKFKVYKNEKQNGRSISSIQIDDQDHIWCRNFTGQNFIVRDDSLHLLYSSSIKNTSHNNFIVDKNKSAWIFDGNSLKMCYKMARL
ncbi:MAG: hypothetical protein IPK03_12980 [Bacteroidetes bacterium]|nr:hypothetical protein [Bacteroidota bacterium]